MLDRYQPRFDSLTPDQATLAACILDLAESDEVLTGRDLFARCLDAGLDQASVVLELLRASRTEAQDIVVSLTGRAIRRCRPGESGLEPDAPATPQRRAPASSPRPARSDPRIVASVAPNPKRPGSASHARYEAWRAGESVDAALARGLTAADVAHDVRRGYVVLES